MEVDFLPEELWEGENYILDDGNEDILDFGGERCGICMDVVIDRGVLDCCQHWFCFACIDNWATITSLCPLCQNEFQLITCVPVYDTVGGNKTDEDINRRDDEWFIEGKNNTLSFPSYYIDENAVICLDEGGCKIRSGSVAVEEDLDIDTSIACDSCDKWYHAFCVGFDAEGTCDSSWLCPRCTVDKVSQKPDGVSILRQSNQHGLGVAGSGHQFESSFSERVSISVADDGETAIVISLLEGNQRSQESSESALGCCKDIENASLSTSISNMPKSEATLADTSGVELNLGQQEMELSLSRDSSYSSSHSLSSAQLKINTDDADKRPSRHLSNKLLDSGLDHDLGPSVGSYISNMKDDVISHAPKFVERNGTSEEYDLPVVSAHKMVSNKMEILSVNSTTPDEKETIIRITGCKRKHRDSRNVDGGEENSEAKFARKKIKADRNSERMCLKDQTAEPVLDDIMVIVQGTDHRPRNQIGHKNSSSIASKERESAAGLRVKKIMRRTGDDKDSSLLVQELRKKIREAVRDKSSKEPGKNLFDPKLLDAFRAALAGSGTENMKPTLDVKAKRLLMQKGKVRESLTKKIYGNGGKRRRAWTRECEVEFWKHRCIKTTKPEKIQTLNSVLDQLRDDSSCSETPGTEEEARSSILSRLYLADTSVFPRKNDIKPVSDLKDIATPEQKRESGSIEKTPTSSPVDHSDRVSAKNISLLVTVPALDGKGSNRSIQGLKAETASSDVHQKRLPKGSSSPALGGAKVSSKKEMVCKSDITKGDKRKWALEVLARKTAASGKNDTQEKGEDNAILKGNYSLLAQLPKDMRPVLAPCRHNKIPISVRQAQLYRLAEHFLKKANLSSICRAAETELAIADAINIEKEVADRSNSKLVFVNLCSQELLRRTDNLNSDRAKESNPCSTSEALSNGEAEETNNSSSDLVVDKALRNAGLMSDSPSNSPIRPIEDLKNGVDSLEKTEDEGPDNVFEVDSHPELDIYGDFEYNLEDDDFIGAGAPKISELQPEPKIKLVFSSLNLGKPDGTLDLQGNEGVADFGTSKVSSVLLESQNKNSSESPRVDSRLDGFLVQNSSVDGDEEPSHAECEELYGPDKEPLIQKYLDSLSTTPFEQIVNDSLLGDNGDHGSNHTEKDSGQPNENYVENSKESTSHFQKTENVMKEKKSNKDRKKESESNNDVMHKVEAYIKEHIRPLCKSGVITVEQYRWAVGKTTGKVMKYHCKEKNANFLIKEGEKVKKLAEQYVEASQQKSKD